MNKPSPFSHFSIALLLALSGCATTAPSPAPTAAPTPVVTTPPAAPAAAAPAPAAVAAESQMTPEQRAQAKQTALKALTATIASTHGDRARLRKLLAIPATFSSRTEQLLAEQVLDLFSDPAFPAQLVDHLPDTTLLAIQSHPDLMMPAIGSALGAQSDQGFSQNLTPDQEKHFVALLGRIYSSATPDECTDLRRTTGPGAGGFQQMMSILDRLPGSASSDWASLVVAALRQPVQPVQPPLTPMQLELVKLNMQHYMSTQSENVRERFYSYYRNGRKPDSDGCWIIGQTANAILSGDDDLPALGVRMFYGSFAKQSSVSQ